jgi:hypothetical protein
MFKRASKSRASGEWNDNVYHVFEGDRGIGRIGETQGYPFRKCDPAWIRIVRQNHRIIKFDEGQDIERDPIHVRYRG